MNREVKFRACHTLTKHWFNENEIVYHNGKWYEDCRAFEKGRELNLDQVKIMQYTGLFDKKGVEICEGDILSNITDNLRCEVVYECGAFKRKWLDRISKTYREYETEPFRSNTHLVHEVIGNIYETVVSKYD